MRRSCATQGRDMMRSNNNYYNMPTTTRKLIFGNDAEAESGCRDKFFGQIRFDEALISLRRGDISLIFGIKSFVRR